MYRGKYCVNSDYSADEDTDDADEEHVYVCMYVAIFRHVWGLLLEEPQKLVHVRISHDYVCTDTQICLRGALTSMFSFGHHKVKITSSTKAAPSRSCEHAGCPGFCSH